MLLKTTHQHLPNPAPLEEDARSDGSREEGREETPKAKKGFAAMDPEKRRNVAAKGGKISRGGGRVSAAKPSVVKQDEEEAEIPGTRKRGFAAMDPEKRRIAAASGGKASHGGGRPPLSKKKSGGQAAAPKKRGFAAMSPEQRKKVASLGGKASQRGKKS